MSDRHREAAVVLGATRTAEIERKVRAAMVAISTEIDANGGIYPKNGGAISKNEISRRAGINLTTLFSPKQKSLGEEVSVWIENLKKDVVVGRIRVRRTFIERADDWKKKFLALQDSHILTELELQAANAERDEAKAEVAQLRAKNSALFKQIREAGIFKVESISKKTS